MKKIFKLLIFLLAIYPLTSFGAIDFNSGNFTAENVKFEQKLGTTENLATLILPETGTRKVVVVNSDEAKHFFKLGYHLMTNLLGASFTPTTAYAERLSISVASNATTIYVSSVLDRDGLVLPLSATNKGYFTLEPGTSREESIVCTSASSTTNTLSGCTRGLAASGSDETGSSARAYSHNAGSRIIMTNIAQFYGNFINVLDPETSSSYIPTKPYNLTTKTWVETRNGYWEGSVANFAALPLTGNSDGAARVTLDDSKLYVWSASSSSWNLAGAGGGAGTVYIDTFLGTDSTGGDNKTFTLTSGSFPDKKYLQVYLNGILMEEGASNDYVATSSNAIIFNNAVLDNDKITMLVVSVDLYNPAWNSVNGDILPDVDNAYDIGSTTKKFKDGYFSGSLSVDAKIETDSIKYNNNYFSVITGENITVSSEPKPVFIKSDGLLYNSNASATTTNYFDGFIISTAATTTSANVYLEGIVSGFVGLATGTNYYISNTGGITSNVASSTYPKIVGKALSSTQIFIDKTSKVFNEYISSSGGIPATRTVTATKPWKYCYATVSPFTSSGSVRGGTVYLERGVITSASQPGDDSYVGISISGYSITASYGNGDTGGLGGLDAYFFGN